MTEHDIWLEDRKLVLATLERLEENDKEKSAALTAIAVEIGALKAKSGFWGLAGSALGVMASMAYGKIKP